MRKTIKVDVVKVDDREVLSSRVINATLLAEILTPELEQAGYKIQADYGEPTIEFRSVRVAERYMLSCQDLNFKDSFFRQALNLWAISLEREIPDANPARDENGDVISSTTKEYFIGCYELYSGKVVIVTKEVMEICPVPEMAEIVHEIKNGTYKPREKNEISVIKTDEQIILYYLYRRFVYNAEKNELTVKNDCSREDAVILNVRCLKGKEKVWEPMHFLYNDYQYMKDPA